MSIIYIFVKGAFETSLESNFNLTLSPCRKKGSCALKSGGIICTIFDVRIKISIIDRSLKVKWTWLWAVIKEVQ